MPNPNFSHVTSHMLNLEFTLEQVNDLDIKDVTIGPLAGLVHFLVQL